MLSPHSKKVPGSIPMIVHDVGLSSSQPVFNWTYAFYFCSVCQIKKKSFNILDPQVLNNVTPLFLKLLKLW